MREKIVERLPVKESKARDRRETSDPKI